MYNIIMIEYCITTDKNFTPADISGLEIINNLETRDNKNKKKNPPMYGVISLMIGLIGILIVMLNFNSLNISFATPILFISVILAGEGIKVDIIRMVSMFGFILSLVFLLISLSPVILYIATIFI
ncbi:MAG: hypothetical protein ACTSQH_08440 [Candidatus Hodarchaeales archaeon]